ncbi:tryptophan--tRNA ligase [Hyphomonas sp. WL0036]|uniref:tryptophan--tRNA ligase n=1 Tax=Hyphomonas sediminis TaxID=2866160 RepID=UPI001C80AE53|nr:tryptophan--tRNA ligase [Hyphomonas sediminis]MBY9065502.1 tryptophan--tRNA ligase [Hyphomonas sediminis]
MTEQTAPAYTGPKRVFSGVQPTGNLHLGNYLGALKKFADLQREGHDCIFSVVDLHAITMPVEKGALISQTRQIAAAFIAAGVDPAKSIIFAQSSVLGHVELAWIFNCTARMGWVERMTQFKDKAGKDAERASVGLFTYPVLQAADILVYKATHVPVGEDQKQHLELSRDIADRFNRDYDVPGFFPLPEPMIKGPGARIMSLKDGTKKMSKSDPSDLSRINLIDDADTIAKKIKKATTDAGVIPGTVEELAGRPEVENLVGIFAALSGRTAADILAEFEGKGFGAFKPALADVTVDHLAPITAKYREILDDQAGLDRVLADGADRANAVAAPIMDDVRRIVGFWRR